MKLFKPPRYTYYIDLEEVWKNGREKPIFSKQVAWYVKKQKKQKHLSRKTGKFHKRENKKIKQASQ